MKRLRRWLIVLCLLAGGGWLLFGPVAAHWRERHAVVYREVEVTRGKIVATVNATGTIKPVRSVQVGTFVSGPIDSILVDFNAEVKKNDLLAKIDPRLFKAGVARDKAVLATRKAEVEQAKAKLQQAKNDEQRSLALHAQDRGFISATELDQFKFNRLALEALVQVAEANEQQAKANLESSVANLEYTEIRSPVDGVIIERKIDPGQTLAATYQTPDLFIVAPDMRKEVHIFASVDETDIGLIRAAQLERQPVRFTVDAYPDDLFQGKIFQIRKNSTTTQNVVTYPVVVTVANPDLKLLPGMTASLSFQVGEKRDILRIPNAALRFFPQREQVRAEDRKLLEGSAQTEVEDDADSSTRSAQEKAELRRQRSRRHVWIAEEGVLRAVEVIIGLNDSRFTEMVSGDLRLGQKLVTGTQPKN